MSETTEGAAPAVAPTAEPEPAPVTKLTLAALAARVAVLEARLQAAERCVGLPVAG